MSLNDPLANVLSHIMNCERLGKNTAVIKPSSKTVKKVLDIMKDNGYIGSYEEIDDGKGMVLKINLLGMINKCSVIKPRYSVKSDGFAKFEKRYLPAVDFGMLIVSTTKGLISHNDAKKQNLGGKLIAYCY
jgi:small subunit ribosomal protein S8